MACKDPQWDMAYRRLDRYFKLMAFAAWSPSQPPAANRQAEQSAQLERTTPTDFGDIENQVARHMPGRTGDVARKLTVETRVFLFEQALDRWLQQHQPHDD